MWQIVSKEIVEFFSQEFLETSYLEFLQSTTMFVVVFIACLLVKSLLINNLKRWADKTSTDLDDLFVSVLESLNLPFFLVVSAWAGFWKLPALDGFRQPLRLILLFTLSIYAVRAIQRAIEYAVSHSTKHGKLDKTAQNLVNTFVGIILWTLVTLLILQNMGLEITSLITGLGIGGIAIAFALQSILADIFASISIFFDKPFQPGDFVIIGTDMGEIKRVGLKSTRIQTLEGDELVISNKELNEVRIHNYKRMRRRRIAFNFGLTYQTPSAKLQKIPQIIKQIIDNQEQATFDRAHFKRFTEYSLQFEVIYFLETDDYNVYMDVQQSINLQIKEQLEKLQVDMAYPTQTLHVQSKT